MLVKALWIIMAYVLGSVPWGVVIARTFCGVDPRAGGSHSTGATNVSRLCGFGWGVATLICDVLKGALSVWVALAISSSPLFVSLTALACVLGHVFSCFMGFRGGKAVATSIGVFLPLGFWQLLAASVLCLLVIWRSRYVSGLSDPGDGSAPASAAQRGLEVAAPEPRPAGSGGLATP